MNPDFQQFAPADDQQFVSMGFLCSMLGLLPAQICVVMQDAGIRFGMVVDCVGHFRVKDAETIANRCSSLKKELADAAAKFEAATQN
ncbi:hypothetical protein Pan44_49560 [Caulifigura coniformis]|uniref:Uncharacterized protein n=1 Tax=Caulifigura coniformis TaxID=2527983 RepID=A0A517SL88_9PLAN|nr:hypothetical protein [Caulifigura coniformis]QDT56894.1 hypothetical protein Pan44_49560 [Caulifigura coniformis]